MCRQIGQNCSLRLSNRGRNLPTERLLLFLDKKKKMLLVDLIVISRFLLKLSFDKYMQCRNFISIIFVSSDHEDRSEIAILGQIAIGN